ncbi:MAG TPA: RHS repeat-associated core domain-containing protein [Ferruginibacter sp.]|nr:RHS repeat-associated core domain-containing protein [Ferruginibacter sp.]
MIQEQAYYPFGLQMAGISSQAAKKTPSPYKYNAGSELEDELNYYNTDYRKYDPQIGRFTGVDILSEQSMGLTPYQFGADDPTMFNDPTGAKYEYPNQMIPPPNTPSGGGGGNGDWGGDPYAAYDAQMDALSDPFNVMQKGNETSDAMESANGSSATAVDGGYTFAGAAAQQVATDLSNALDAGKNFSLETDNDGNVETWHQMKIQVQLVLEIQRV